MKSPARYTGYNEEGHVVVVKYGEDADNYLNPASVQYKIRNVNETMNEQITLIQNALRDIVADANQAIVVDNTSMGPVIEDLADTLETIKNSPEQALEDVYTQSISAHDQIQDGLNERARGSVVNTPGVIRWS